jgi:AcrR family transcriptional regulator
MPKVFSGYKDQVRERIKQEALNVFATKGYYSTSMNDIAENLDCSKATLYQYFKSKDDLFVAAFDYRIQRRQELLLTQLEDNIEFFATEEFFMQLYNSMTNSLRFSFEVINIARENVQLREKLTIGNEKALSRFLEFFESQKAKGIVRKDIDSKLIATMFLALRDGITNIPSYAFDLDMAKKSWVLLAEKFLEIILPGNTQILI